MLGLINAPSILGLRPSGVELLPEALTKAGLTDRLPFSHIETVVPPAYSAQRDPATHMLNPQAIATYSSTLADTVQNFLEKDTFPLVLGGDCSIVLGSMLALKRRGRYGLFFLDGHADFYQPEASETGEAADMDLALVSGRGPKRVTSLEGQSPLVLDTDVVQFGQRDKQETLAFGSQQIADTLIHVYELDTIHQNGVERSCKSALDILLQQPIEGFFIHIDADVLHDDEMPAVDYRLPDGLTFAELETVLKVLIASNKAVGLELTVFNPTKDPHGYLAKKLVHLLSTILSPLQ